MNIQNIAQLIADRGAVVQRDAAFFIQKKPENPARMHFQTFDMNQLNSLGEGHRLGQLPYFVF